MNINITKRSAFMYYLLSVIIFGTIFIGCKKDDPIEANMPKAITVSENRFVDNYGRHVILKWHQYYQQIKRQRISCV